MSRFDTFALTLSESVRQNAARSGMQEQGFGLLIRVRALGALPIHTPSDLRFLDSRPSSASLQVAELMLVTCSSARVRHRPRQRLAPDRDPPERAPGPPRPRPRHRRTRQRTAAAERRRQIQHRHPNHLLTALIGPWSVPNASAAADQLGRLTTPRSTSPPHQGVQRWRRRLGSRLFPAAAHQLTWPSPH